MNVKLRDILQIAVVFTAATIGGIYVKGASARAQSEEDAETFSAARYERATAYLHDSLGKASTSRLGAATPRIVILLREKDYTRCEDLGRQLRELARAAGPVAIEIWTDSAITHAVGRYARIERVPVSRVQSVSWDSVYAGSAIKPISPAVLLIDDRRTLVAAVAHPGRFANARPISFASELAAQLEDLAARGTPHSP